MNKLKNLFARVPKRFAVMAAALVAVITPAIVMAWGPDRPTFTIANPAPYVTFNSITDNPAHGDERNFMQVKPSDAPNSAYSEKVNIEAGKEYDVFVYYHNNAKSSLNASGTGIATGAQVRAQIPAQVEGTKKAVAYVEAANSNPLSVWDDVEFASSSKTNLDFVAGSAHIYNFGKTNGAQLADTIVAGGAPIGYDALDGKVPGCNEFSGYVVFKVKATSETPNFTVTKEVREDGKNAAWVKDVKVNPGTKVNYRLTFGNTGETTLNNVTLKDQLPAGMTFVPGSVYIRNASFPNGAPVQNGDQLIGNGINIGSYTPGSNAQVVFDATVQAEKDLPCGVKQFHNIASATPEGKNPKDDSADVGTEKKCEETKVPEYKCTALTVTPITDTQFTFAATHEVKNAEFVKFTYVVRDGNGTEIARSENPVYNQTKPGNYTVEAILTVKVDGQEKQAPVGDCKKPFEVKTQPETPVYACESLTKIQKNRDTYDFTVKASSKGNVQIKEYKFVFGDGQSQIVGAGQETVSHTYAEARDYTAQAFVTFEVDGKTVTGKTSDNCKVDLTVKPIPPAECKPGIPMNDARCKEVPTTPEQPKVPGELPSTGPEAVVGSALGSSALGLGVHSWLSSRRRLKDVSNKR